MKKTTNLTFFSPSKRYNLLHSVLNKKILNIYRCFSDEKNFNRNQDYIEGYSSEDVFLSAFSCVTIEFEDGLSIDITPLWKRLGIKQSNQNGHKWGVRGFIDNPFKWNLSDEKLNNSEIRKVLGQKVENVRLFNSKIFITNFVNCIEFELSNQNSLVLGLLKNHKGFDCNMLYISSDDILLKDLKNKEYAINTPDFDFEFINDYLIEAKDLRDNEFIEIYYPYGNGNDYPFNLKTDIYIDKLGKKPLENYFMLNTVRSGIFNNQVAIMDLKFGISNEHELKIIRPVDIYKGMIWETNIHFINSLMNEISKMIPEELEDYFSKYR